MPLALKRARERSWRVEALPDAGQTASTAAGDGSGGTDAAHLVQHQHAIDERRQRRSRFDRPRRTLHQPEIQRGLHVGSA